MGNRRKILTQFEIIIKYKKIIQCVDDILIIYNNNKYIEEQIAQKLKTIHRNMEFTHKTETSNYLDLTLNKNFGTNRIEIEI